MNKASSEFCRQTADRCRLYGTFNPAGSHALGRNYDLSSGSSFAISGYAYTDTFSFPDNSASFSNLQFIVADKTDKYYNILGLGFPAHEAQVAIYDQPSYPNLPKLMVDKGLIRTGAYSLWLGSEKATYGSLVFGGVDAGKFNGELTTFSVLPDSENKITHFLVELTQLTLSLKSSSSKSPLNSKAPVKVLIDSGTTGLILPRSLVGPIYQALGVFQASGDVRPLVDCKYATSSPSEPNFDFMFKTAKISIPLSRLAEPPDENGRCAFRMYPANCEAVFCVLGARFINSAYVVFDTSHSQISIAQANLDPNSRTKMIEIPAAGVKALKLGKSYVSNADGNPTIKDDARISEGSEPQSIDSVFQTADSDLNPEDQIPGVDSNIS